MSFFESSPESRELGDALVKWTLERFCPLGLEPDKLALTLLHFQEPLKPEKTLERPAGFAYRGDQPFYPCSVVKVFYLAAAHARMEEGAIAPHPELDRAMGDMIRWSSNTATNYIIDLVTGTTGDTLLSEAEMSAWIDRRQSVNRYFRALGWPETEPINICQKLMDDDRYGRERVFVRMGGNNHNRLTTNATARLFHTIFAGRMVSADRSRAMASALARPIDDPAFCEHPAAQIRGYFGTGLRAGARLWSKAGQTGWTGDADASYRRHDAAYVELPTGHAFVLVVFTQGRSVSQNESVLPTIAARTAELIG